MGSAMTLTGWTRWARANVILDNLIAQGKTKPSWWWMTFGMALRKFCAADLAVFRGAQRCGIALRKVQRGFAWRKWLRGWNRLTLVRKDQTREPLPGFRWAASESLLTGLNNLDNLPGLARLALAVFRRNSTKIFQSGCKGE